jgi:hypothetical protein
LSNRLHCGAEGSFQTEDPEEEEAEVQDPTGGVDTVGGAGEADERVSDAEKYRTAQN